MTYKYIYLHMRKRMFRIHLLSKKTGCIHYDHMCYESLYKSIYVAN